MTDGALASEDVVYSEVRERPLHVDIFKPPNGSLRTAVVQIHGGRWRLGSRKQLHTHARRLSELGFTCLAIEYRSVNEAPWPANLHDVRAAIRYTRRNADELGIDEERIALQGFSAGGYLALMAAGTNHTGAFRDTADPAESTRVSAVAAAYPSTCFFAANEAESGGQAVSDAEGRVASWLLMGDDASADEIADADVVGHVSAAFPPTFLAHGTGDLVIPYGGTMRLFSALTAHGVDADLHLTGGQDHVFDAGPSFGEVLDQEVALFLRRTVAEPEVIAAETPTFEQVLARAALEAQGIVR